MNRKDGTRHIRRLGLGAVATALLAGCGGGNEGTTPPLPTASGQSAAAPASPESMARDQAAMRQLGSFSKNAEASRKAAQAASEGARGFNVVLASPSIAERFAEDDGRVRALSASQGEGVAGAAAAALRVQRMAYNSTLQEEQTRIGDRIQALGAKVVAENRAAINMVTIEATVEQAEAIRSLPGVQSVSPVMVLQKPGVPQSVKRQGVSVSGIHTTCNYPPENPIVRALFRRSSSKAELLSYHHVNAAHQAGITGMNVRVAVLDDGLDYTHSAHGGPGTAAMLNRAQVYAFAPDASRLASAMFPYPNSKVLGGYDFVRNDLSPFPEFKRLIPAQGETWSGCVNIESHGTNVTDILQTVAPDARFYIYKVCGDDSTGCPDSAIVGGLNRALDPLGDGSLQSVDIATASLGASAGRLSTPITIAANNLAKAGVVVTFAAGNDGPVAHAIATPAVAPKVTAVAEVQGPARKRANGDPLDLSIMEYTSSSGPSTDGMAIKPEVGAIGQVTSAMAGTGDGVSFFGGTSGATPVVAGVYALLKQKYPQLSPAQLHARLVNTSRPGAVWGGRAQFDTVHQKTLPDGTRTTDWSVPANTVQTVTAANLNTLGFSNAPFRVSARTPVPAMRLGGGEVNAAAALRSPALFYAVDDERDAQVVGDSQRSHPASANFGKVSVSRPTALPAKTLWVENLGPAARTFAVSHTFSVPDKAASGAVTVSFSPSTVTVPAGGRVAVTMSMNIDPSRLPADRQYKSVRGFLHSNANLPYRQFRDECTPSDAVCMWLDTFDGKIELKDATETLRLPWQVMPLRGSEIVATASTAATGQKQVTVANIGTAQTGQAEFYDWLGSHEPDAARVRDGRLHILAWGARQALYDVSTGEVTGGWVAGIASRTRRVIQVAYLLDRNSLFTGSHSAQGTGNTIAWGASTLRLGIDVDGDGQCGNKMGAPFRFRARNPGESWDDYYSAYTAARWAFWTSTAGVNTAAQASDQVVSISVNSVFEPDNALGGEALNTPSVYTFGISNLGKSSSQIIRGRHLETWAADKAPRLFLANHLNVGGVAVDYRSGVLVSFVIPIDDSPLWFTNKTGDVGDIEPAIPKPGSPAPVIGGTGSERYTRFGLEGQANLIEGVRLNPGQRSVTLCPMVADYDIAVDKTYPARAFTLDTPRFQVAGVSPSVGLTVAPGASVVRDIAVNPAAHPALGLLVRSWRDKREVNLISLP